MRVILLFGLVFSGCQHGFHPREVISGQIEVSSQPTPDQLLRLIRIDDLRSVLNLRSEDRRRFTTEVRACRQAGAGYHAVAIPLEDWTPRPKLLQLVKILQTSPRPLLIHCRNGVDRSGLAAAVALLLEDHSLREAWKQMPPLSRWRARHGGRPLARVLMDYEFFLSRTATPTSGENFRDWVENHYCPEPYKGRVKLLKTPPKMVEGRGKIRLSIHIENLGSEAWDFASGDVALGFRLSRLSADRKTRQSADAFQPGNNGVIDCGRARVVQNRLTGGAGADWDVVFKLPEISGAFLARVDLLRNGAHWFSDMGWPAPTWKLEIPHPTKED